MMIHVLPQVKKVGLFHVLPLLFRRTKVGEKKFGPNLLTFFLCYKGNHKSKTIYHCLAPSCLPLCFIHLSRLDDKSLFFWKIKKKERWEEQSYIAILRIPN